jgi:uridylate kinase
MDNQNLKRIALKISGEQIGSSGEPLDFERAGALCAIPEALVQQGYQVALIMGAGNLVRGRQLIAKGFGNDTLAHQMGMLSTVINGQFIKGLLDDRGKVTSLLFSNIPVPKLGIPELDDQHAQQLLQDGQVVLVAGGHGEPGFTTDSGVVEVAARLGCQIVIKATKVDGVYDKDPHQFDDAIRYERLTYQQVQDNPEIKVMDRWAMDFAAQNGLTIAVCQSNPQDVLAVLSGDTSRGTIVTI